MSAPLVVVDGLVVRAGGRAVVDGVSLELAPGEAVGVAGPSGAGKTAIAHAVVGYTRPGLARTAGRVSVAGLDPFSPRQAARLRGRRVTSLVQDPASGLDPAHTVRWHLQRALRRGGVGAPARDARVQEVLDRVRLPARLLHAHPHELSGGQAQRAGLAIAVAAQPDLVVLDEPTSNLDPELTTFVVDLLRTLTPTTALLVVSHDPEVLAASTDRVLHVERGRLTTPRVPPPRVAVVAVADQRRRPAPVGAAIALRAAEVAAGYDGHLVLTSASLQVAAGECLALVGGSGSGKSTLARCLAGLHVPTGGTLTLAEEQVPWPASRRAGATRLDVAHVGQDSRAALNPRESVRRALDRARRAAARRGRSPLPGVELLARVGLPASVLERRPGQLSGGERQRVNLARALAACPRVVVCDEVTASLDRTTEDLVLAALGDLRATTGLAVVLITHSAVVADRADRTHLLLEGSLT